MSGKKRKHCKNGHELTPENTLEQKHGRVCRTCNNEWYKKNHKKNRDKRNAESTSWYKAHPEQAKQNSRNTVRKNNGWTPEHAEEVLAEQENLCAICHKEFDGTPHADHEHTTPPKPRGMLCKTCNWGLGMFYDNPGLLREAADYLEKFQ